ncbi:MAG: hypothetical protein OEW19_05300, partial [Acidobacteriota bacterium]|nr:hypothetical protein [Acidobacteriota bacterium]
AMHPDGRWIAYESNESGRPEIIVRPFPAVESGRWDVTTSGGSRPVWGPDGRELFYWLDGRIMVMPVETRPVFSHGRPTSVGGAGNYLSGAVGVRNFDIATDGRILALKPSGEAGFGDREIRVVLNWTEELKSKVP